MAISYDEAINLQPGALVNFDDNPAQYEVALVAVDGPRVKVLVERDDHAEGMNTWFDERHLGIVNLASTIAPIIAPAEEPDAVDEPATGDVTDDNSGADDAPKRTRKK